MESKEEHSELEILRKRVFQPRLGACKTLRLISEEIANAGIKLGRDRYFPLLRDNGVFVKPKPRKPKITNFQHSLPVFQNLVSGMNPSKPNKVWMSDFTYIDTGEGTRYAALITDAFSRKIVGSNSQFSNFKINDSLESEKCAVPALDEALKNLPQDAVLINHSDRGSQYCCHKYADRLSKRNIKINMTEVLHCCKNALAKRVNGILKQEYEMDGSFRAKNQDRKAFERSVFLYNNRRPPHMGIGYQIPAQFHEKKQKSDQMPPASPRFTFHPSGTGSARRSWTHRTTGKEEAFTLTVKRKRG